MLLQPDSLYNQGMKPLMYSEKNAAERKIGWIRHGEDIKYYRNNVKLVACKTLVISVPCLLEFGQNVANKQ